MTQEVLDPHRWFRVGAGRRKTVPGLEPAAVARAIARLPDAHSPYVVVAHDLVKSGSHFVSNSRAIDADELQACVDRGVWQFFIISEDLSRGLLLLLPSVDAQTLSINGAVNLQLGRVTRGGVEPASLGVVNKVATAEGDVREHLAYTAIFDSLVRTLSTRS